jgi:HAD superfamily hydrolase (TIGR01549 family)
MNIFLDAGGVILDETEHENKRAELSVKLLLKYNKNYSLNQYWLDLNEAVNSYITHIYKYIFWKNTKEINIFNKLFDEYQNNWIKMNVPLTIMSGLKEVLVKISKNNKIGILGQYDQHIIEILKKSNLIQYFNYTETQEKYNITKPDPRYFENILKALNINASDSIMVGDRIDKDIIPAKQIGMKYTIRIKTGIHKNQASRYPDEFPNYEINEIKELIEIIEKIS